MKKKVLVISAIAFAVILLVSVALFVLPSLNIGRVDGNLKLEKGVLLWDDIPNAAGYEVDLGSGGIPVSENQYNLAANCGYSGKVSVTVRAIQQNNSRTDIGSMNIAVNKLAQPIVSVEGEGEDVYFVWSAVENASGYTYDAHDGNGTVSAVADEHGRYRVNVSNMDEQMIRVTALGGSADGIVYASNDCLYRYSSNRVFDLALIAEHPAVYYATGSLGVEEHAKVGTCLPKGTYKMTVSLYASTVSGDKLRGNGTWGRRIVDYGNPRVHLWMCEDAPSADWPDAGGTIPYPDQVVTVELLVRVDINSNALIPCYDFDQGDMVVIKDIVMDGKSVLNDRNGEPNPEMVIDPFDLDTLDNYLAVYKGLGEWMARDKSNYSDFVLRVPTKLSDGAYCVQVNYYVCGPNGEMLTGNGLWGRRVSAKGVKTDDMCWLIEYDVDQYKATDIPFPTSMKSHVFEVDVKNGFIELEFYDFNEGEYFIVESVKQAPPVPGGFDLTKLDNYLASYRGTVEWLARDRSNIQDFTLRIPTDLSDGEHTVQINYYVCNSRGGKLTGNGLWGRRVLPDVEKNTNVLWLNEAQVEDYPAVVMPEPTQMSSCVIDVEVKDGNIELYCLDFDKGDHIIVESVTAAPPVPGGFDLTKLDSYLASYRGTGEWLARDRSNIQDFTLRIPTTLSSGEHTVQINYYVCNSRGGKLSGSGLWGRRVLPDVETNTNVLWLNETQVEEYPAVVMPEPTQLSSCVIDVEVKDGYIELYCLDFDKGDYIIVESVKQAPPVPGGFDLTKLDNYLASYRGTGEWLARDRSNIQDFALRIPTELSDGAQAVKISYYVCNSRGGKLTGNGLWGRRVLPDVESYTNVLWLNEEQVDDYLPVELPEPTQCNSVTIDVVVKDGYIELFCLDFNKGDYIIVESVEAAAPVAGGFDLTKLDNYLASYRGTGEWLARDRSNIQDFALRIPTELSDGAQAVKISYYVCNSRGGKLSGSGLWGRRVLPDVETNTNVLWLNETQVEEYPAVVMPEPTQLSSCVIDVEVKDGYIELYCLDFDKGDYIIVESVEAAAPVAGGFDLTKLDSYLASYRGTGEWLARDRSNIQDFILKVPVELANGEHTVAVNYYVCDSRGAKLSGNGLWGRRVLRDGANDADTLWLNEEQVNDYQPVQMPEPTQLNSFTAKVEVKDGYFELLCLDFNKGDYIIVETVEVIATEITIDSLTFIDCSNGYVFSAETTTNLVEKYGAWKKLNVTVQVQKGSSADELKNAELTQVQAFFNLDESGRMMLYGADEYRGAQLVIPAGTVITPSEQALSQDALVIVNEITLVRDPSNWGTINGWQQATFVDVTLSFKDASNGYLFDVTFADPQKAFDLKEAYDVWGKNKLEVTVSSQFGSNASSAGSAALKEVSAFFNVDDNGKLRLYGANEYSGVKLVIPAGSMVVPTNPEKSNVRLRIVEQIVLKRASSNYGTNGGWQIVTEAEPEPEPDTTQYTDIKLTYKNASNGLVFNVASTEDLKKVYGTWKNLEVTIRRKFSRTSAQEALNAQFEEVTAVFNVDDNGYLCLYNAGDVGCVEIEIPAGTVIIPSDKALSDTPLRITHDIVLVRENNYWMTSNGWIQQETE